MSIDDILKNEVPNRHSYFQLKYFVIGKEPTIQAKLWRILRELRSRKDALDSIELELAETKDNIELLDYELNEKAPLFSLNDSPKVAGVKTRKLERQKINLEKNLGELESREFYTRQEADFLVKQYESLSQVEKLKSFDDLESQKEIWNTKLSQELNLRQLMGSPLDIEVITTILALPNDTPIKRELVFLIEETQKKLLEQKSKGAEKDKES